MTDYRLFRYSSLFTKCSITLAITASTSAHYCCDFSCINNYVRVRWRRKKFTFAISSADEFFCHVSV